MFFFWIPLEESLTVFFVLPLECEKLQFFRQEAGFPWVLSRVADVTLVVVGFGLINLCGNGAFCSVVLRSGQVGLK